MQQQGHSPPPLLLRIPLLLLVFTSFISLFSTPTFAKSNSPYPPRDEQPQPLPWNNDQHPLQPSTLTQVPGQDAVREAIAQLHHLRPSALRRHNHGSGTGGSFFSLRGKPSGGLLGTVWYYLKQLFVLLFMNGPAGPPSSAAISTSHRMAKQAVTAKQILEDAAHLDNPDAIYLLADMHFYGKYTVPLNYTYAFEQYQRLADMTGNSSAQFHLGFIYATGIGGAVEQDQAKALLYHTFAADGGDLRAKMTAAYRYHAGIATSRNCDLAVEYYAEIAERAISYMRSGPPGGRLLPKDAFRLVDEGGGLYGEGASTSGAPASDVSADMVEFYNILSRTGQPKATYGLGKLHYYGSRTVKPDYRKAKEYFLDLARRYWTKDGEARRDTEPGLDKIAAKAAGYLGTMFLRAEGMEQNFQHAKVWFRRGYENGDARSQYSMGLMHLHGLGMPENPVRAADFFKAAADQDFTEAYVRLGTLFMDQGELEVAVKYFELAARKENIEAFYYLAELSNFPVQNAAATAATGELKQPVRNCNHAAHYYKRVVERVEPIHSSFKEANDAYDDGDYETALLLYMMAAEQGYEAAQANVAFMLDQQRIASNSTGRLSLSKFLPAVLNFGSRASMKLDQIKDLANVALIYWTRSAKQANIDSMLKMGDYYLANLVSSGHSGPSTTVPSTNRTTNESTSQQQSNFEKAAACYTAAAETMQSAQAYFNLGWMHENGLGGLTQDFHLAKRYYDQAAEVSSDAQVPVNLALIKLRARSFWNSISGGAINSIDSTSPDEDAGIDGPGLRPKKKRRESWAEWFRDFITADLEEDDAPADQRGGGHNHEGGREGGIISGRDQWRRQLPNDDAAPHGMHEAAAAAGRNEEMRAEIYNGYAYTYRSSSADDVNEDDYNYERSRHYYDDDDDEDDYGNDSLVETFIIVGLAAALAILMYYRQRQQLHGLREEEVERQRVRRQLAQEGAGSVLLPSPTTNITSSSSPSSSTSAGASQPSGSTASNASTHPNSAADADVPRGLGEPGPEWVGPGGVGH